MGLDDDVTAAARGYPAGGRAGDVPEVIVLSQITTAGLGARQKQALSGLEQAVSGDRVGDSQGDSVRSAF